MKTYYHDIDQLIAVRFSTPTLAPTLGIHLKLDTHTHILRKFPTRALVLQLIAQMHTSSYGEI